MIPAESEGSQATTFPLTPMAASKPKRLPPELLDIVIGNFHNDFRTSSRCALVSRNWLYSARRNHFRTVRIDYTINKAQSQALVRNANPYWYRKCTSLIQLLDETPALAIHIGVLKLQIDLDSKSLSKSDATSVLSTLLARLTTVYYLSVWFSSLLPDELLAGLMKFDLKSLKIKQMTFLDVTSFQRFIASYCGLQYLDVHRIVISEEVERRDKPHLQADLPSLRRLRVCAFD